MSRHSNRKLLLGVAGLGRAFSLMLPTFARDPRVHLVAGADLRPEARQRFVADFGGRSYGSVEALCADPDIDVIYVATPHKHHAEHARLAAQFGKNVLVEKPMALNLEEAASMIEAARRAGVHLLVGHSHSFDTPILRTRDHIASGVFGRVRMITALNFTDFLYRPRVQEDLDPARGGGALFNQAPHQIDIVRLLGGGRVKSVRARTGAWDPTRATEGAYSALLMFEDGAFASLTYSGFGHFDSDEFEHWISEMGRRKARQSRAAPRRFADPKEEAAFKAAHNYGGSQWRSSTAKHLAHQHFGTVVVSCERADLRPTPTGVMIYEHGRARLDPLPPPRIPRAEVIDELYDVVVRACTPLHDGAWGMATLEVCLAMVRSAREGQEIALENQGGLR